MRIGSHLDQIAIYSWKKEKVFQGFKQIKFTTNRIDKSKLAKTAERDANTRELSRRGGGDSPLKKGARKDSRTEKASSVFCNSSVCMCHFNAADSESGGDQCSEFNSASSASSRSSSSTSSSDTFEVLETFEPSSEPPSLRLQQGLRKDGIRTSHATARTAKLTVPLSNVLSISE